MPKLKKTVPKMCRHARGQAFVKIDGEQIWLGPHGSPEAQENYDRTIAEWLSNGRRLPEPEPPVEQITVREIILEYWKWVRERYAKSGVDRIKSVLRILESLYGSTPAREFGPKRLRVCRDEMIRRGWTRKNINQQTSSIRTVFKWAEGRELLEGVYDRLAKVEPLKRGEAPENPPVKPVPRHMLRRTRAQLSRQVRALVDLQLLTASRADQLVQLRAIDIDRSRPVWRIEPEEHKTAHHDKALTIYFGPRAQRILRLFMADRDPEDYLFSPREANAAARRQNAKGARRPNQRPNPRKTDRRMGEHYTTESYRRQIHRACEKAFPAPEDMAEAKREQWRQKHLWSPHRLRHTAATSLRREFGVEVAATILGHSNIKVTEIYAERNIALAENAIAQVG